MRGTKAKRIRRAIKAGLGIAKMPTNDQRQYVIGRQKDYHDKEGKLVRRMVTYVNAPFQARSLFLRWKRGTNTMPTLRGAA